MKSVVIFLIAILSCGSILAQFGSQQIVSNFAYGWPTIVTADLDSDGDLDILLAGQYDIAWFENTNGLGIYGSKHVIAEMAWEYAYAVSAADLDGDGDMDVLSGFGGEPPGISKITWNENLDGQGSFGPQKIITLEAAAPLTAISADFDNDSDMDVLTVDRGTDKIAWYENLDGLGNFGPQNVVSTSLDWPQYGFVDDIDNDGDMDILSNSYEGNRIAWFENIDGLGTFSDLKIISTNVDQPGRVFLADIDMDNDLDAVSTSKGDNKIAWYENIDGLGTFGPQLLITTNILNPRTLFIQDLDNDNDPDILSNDGHSIIWYENLNGSGTFGSPLLISDEVLFPSSVFVSDIDQDQDFDVLSASHADHKIAWYENLTILNNVDFKQSKKVIHPNPTRSEVTINSTEEIALIELFDSLGKKLKTFQNSNSINLENLSHGIYFAKITNTQGASETHKIIKL